MVMRRGARSMVLMLFAIGLWSLLGNSPSHAAPGDRIASFDVAYVIDPEGTVSVTETIVYEFGGVGRHGIVRTLALRVPYDDHRDRSYAISNFAVSSPTGARTDIRMTSDESPDGRTGMARFYIGSPAETVDATETYVLTYTLRGALDEHEGADTEFYWNVTGNDSEADLGAVTASVSVPGGATQVACVHGGQGASTQCDLAEIDADGIARFSVGRVAAGDRPGVTIVVGIDRDAVAAPIRLHELVGYGELNGFSGHNLALGAGAVVVMTGTLEVLRRRNRNLRFAGYSPGVVPSLAGARVVHDENVESPVSFAPPRDVSPAEASVLLGHTRPALITSATLLDLAHRGAVQVVSKEDGGRRLRLVDDSIAQYPFERLFLSTLFRNGEEVSLRPAVDADFPSESEPASEPTGPSPMADASDSLNELVLVAVGERDWFTGSGGGWRQWSFGLSSLLALAGVLMLGLSWLSYTRSRAGGWGVWGCVCIVAAVIMFFYAKKGHSGRTAVGTAVHDQLVGFKLYLETAEPDHLEFGEESDIFSKYLPWAVAFGISRRWTEVCVKLRATGRIPETPSWYVGAWNIWMWESSISADVTTAAQSPVNSGGGWLTGGGGSGFGGGARSGGGGGGGGTGSW